MINETDILKRLNTLINNNNFTSNSIKNEFTQNEIEFLKTIKSLSLPNNLEKLTKEIFSYFPNLEKLSFYSFPSIGVDERYTAKYIILLNQILSKLKKLKILNLEEFPIDRISLPNLYDSNPLLEEITFPKTLKIFHTNPFRCHPNIKSITFPNTKIIIFDYAFSECPSLEKVIINDYQNEPFPIALGAFLKCKNLQTINFFEHIKIIENSAFSNCSSLEHLNFSKNLKRIRALAFANCSNLKTITFIDEGPEELILYDNSFTSSPIEKIDFPKGIKRITIYHGNEEYKINIKDIFLHGVRIDPETFFNRANKEIFIIDYYNFKDAISQIKFLKDINSYSLLYNYEVYFIGPPLTEKQMNRLINIANRYTDEYFKYYKNNYLYFLTRETTLESSIEQKNDEPLQQENISKSKNNQEIEETLEKISEFLKYLPSESSEIVKSHIDKIIIEYEQTISLNIENNSNTDNPNFRLLLKLKNILMKLSGLTSNINLLKTIINCKKIISNNNLSINSNNNVENYIINILTLANDFEEPLKNKIINNLNIILDKNEHNIKNSINNYINNIFTNNIELILQHSNLTLELSTYLDEIKLFHNKAMPFVSLLKTLKEENLNDNEKEPHRVPTNINIKIFENLTIDNTINIIRRLINQIDNSNYKEDLSNEFNQIVTKYIKMIENAINQNKLNNFSQLEIDLRTELKPLLNKLSIMSEIDDYIKELKNELLNCLTIMKQNTEIKDKKTSIIESFTIDILNAILNSNLDTQSINLLKENIITFINSYLSIIEKNIIPKDDIIKNFSMKLFEINKTIETIKNKQINDQENNQTLKVLRHFKLKVSSK